MKRERIYMDCFKHVPLQIILADQQSCVPTVVQLWRDMITTGAGGFMETVAQNTNLYVFVLSKMNLFGTNLLPHCFLFDVSTR